jgi:hypothetical protein
MVWKTYWKKEFTSVTSLRLASDRSQSSRKVPLWSLELELYPCVKRTAKWLINKMLKKEKNRGSSSICDCYGNEVSTVIVPNLGYIILQLLYQFLLFINLSWKFCYLLFGCFEWRCFFRKFDLKMVELHLKNNRYNTYRSYPARNSLRKQITWFSIPKHGQYSIHNAH